MPNGPLVVYQVRLYPADIAKLKRAARLTGLLPSVFAREAIVDRVDAELATHRSPPEQGRA